MKLGAITVLLLFIAIGVSCALNRWADDARCGGRVCAPDQYCCNPSCGICVPLGGLCTQQICPPRR